MSVQRTARSLAPGSPYRGRAGQTRNESVQVWMPNGEFRTLHIYVSVDASADPALAKAAREGVLHAVSDDVDLAVPFIYHDPELPLFVLVIPEALRHQALSLRASALARVAEDPAHEVPGYVAECECVVGPLGLRQRIMRPGGNEASWAAGAQRDLSEREAVLARWESDLRQRERELDARYPLDPSSVAGWPFAVEDEELEEVPPSLAPPYAEQDYVQEEAVERVEYMHPMRPQRESTAFVLDEELLDEGSIRPSMAPPPLPFARVSQPQAPVERDEVPPPPEWFAGDHDQPLCARYHDGRVWLYARGLPPEEVDAGELDLLVQVDPDAATPVVLLTLVHGGPKGGAPRVLRCAVRYLEEAGRAVLQRLSEHFVVELVYVGETSLLSYEATLAAPREDNARAVLEHLGLSEPVSEANYLAAEASTLKAPPPWRDRGHPFVTWDEDQQVRSATEAAVELDELSTWSTPERQLRLTLLLSVPPQRVRDHTARGIQDALGFGLRLPPPLVDHALARGLAEDETSLFRERVAGLMRTTRSKDGGGMGRSVLAALWTEALDEAAQLALTLDDETIEVAETLVGEKARIHARGLKVVAALSGELASLAQDPPDMAAARTLVELGGLSELRAVCRATAQLQPEQAAELFVAMARRGQPTSDALVGEITRGRDDLTRFGAALALSVRRAPGAIDALVRAIREADPPLWQALTFALGHYGGGSFRAITRSMVSCEMPDGRLTHVLAHLSLHGARSQVLRLSRGGETGQTRAAKRALTLANGFKQQRPHAQGLESESQLTVLSEKFHALWLAQPK